MYTRKMIATPYNILKVSHAFETMSIKKTASDEEDEEKDKPGILSTIGHFALDLAGLIPGVGEFADAANAAWYVKQGDYLMAGLSIISVIPVVGDIVGKGGKLTMLLAKAGKSGKYLGEAGKYILTLSKYIKNNKGKIAMIIKLARKNDDDVDEHADKIENALYDFADKADKDIDEDELKELLSKKD